MKFEPAWTEESEDIKIIQNELLAHVEKSFGPPQRSPFSWVVRDEKLKIGAGVSGFVHWNWVYISQLWVQDAWQGQGCGQILIEKVEEWAKQQHYLGLYIDTFEVKVRKFYEKRGFTLVGQIPNFPNGGNRYFLFKKI